MIRSELVTEIRNKLGYNTGLAASLITTAINNAQRELEKMPELPWFLHTEVSSINATADEERLPVPTDFIREIDEEPLYYYDTASNVYDSWVPLRRLVTADLRRKYNLANVQSTVTSGSPVYYALDGAYFRLYPIPDAAYVMKLTYYKQQDLLTADGDSNDWSTFAPYALIGKAGLLLSQNNRSKEGQAIFGKLYTDAMQQLMYQSEAREHAGASYQRGGDD